MRLCFVLLFGFFSLIADSVKQPVLRQARALSSTVVYLSWEGPIDHPGGFRYRIYLKDKASSHFRKYIDVSGSTRKYFLTELQANVRYTICVGVVDRRYETKSECQKVAIVTTPAQEGHVSRTDRKYLTKGGYYQSARHYWPFDYETSLRDVKYSVNGTLKGTGVSIMGKSRGFLRTNGNGWVRLGRFRNECLCDMRRCRKDGFSVSLWVKLLSLDNGTKVLVGSESSFIRNTTGMVIFQSTRRNGDRVISALVFMDKQKWKIRFSVKPDIWFYLTVTWKESTGLRMYKDGHFMISRDKPKLKPFLKRKINTKCSVSLSPPSGQRPLAAYYDDLVIWNYELESRDMIDVYKNTWDPPMVRKCETADGESLDIHIGDEDNIYELKGNYKISWKHTGGIGRTISNYTNGRTFHITGLESSFEYEIAVQWNTSKNVLSRPSQRICDTRVGVPLKPRSFTVREKASTYLFLEWQPPTQVYGIVKGYKISYRVDDFSNNNWIASFRADVHKSSLDNLRPFTDYIIKLLCRNAAGGGSELTLRATTAEGVPGAPRRLRVLLRRNELVIKWREPLHMNGMVEYRVVALVNDNTIITVCTNCGEYHRMNNTKQNTTYTFWAIAYNINNNPRYESERSNNFTISTPSFTPSVPRSVVAQVKSSGIHVFWKPSKFLNGNVDYKLVGRVNEREELFCTKCGLHNLVNDVKQSANYSFWVIAYNVGKGYESPASPTVYVEPASFVPSIPRSVTINITTAGIMISWKESRVLKGEVQYKLMGEQNRSSQEFCSECGLQYLLSNAEPNTNYSFWVIAYNVKNDYESAPSTVVRFHTTGQKSLVQPPESIVVPHIEDSSASLSWKPPKGIAQDIVGYLVTLYDGHNVLRTITTRNRQLKFTQLNQFSKYYVIIQVQTKDGYGLPSAQIIIQTKDTDECLANEIPCGKYADCVNSPGSYFCSCTPGYVGDGKHCEALPLYTTKLDFCPEEKSRNITWEITYRGHTDRKLCPNGSIGISTRKCIAGNGTGSYWTDADLSNCVSAWMSALDDKLADHSLNSTVVGDFFLNLLEENDKRGLYGGDVIRSVEVIAILYNKSKDNELDPRQTDPKATEKFVKNLVNITERIVSLNTLKVWNDIPKDRRAENGAAMIKSLENVVVNSAKIVNYSFIQNENIAVWFGDLASLESQSRNTSYLHAQYDGLNSLKFPKFGRRKRKDITADRTSVAVIKYKTIGDILSAGEQKTSDTNDEFVNTAVLSVTMDPPIPPPFQEPFEFLLKNRKEGGFEKPKCVFFNMSRNPGFWSTNGCMVFNTTATFTVCHCYHMTSFSVLMQVKDVELSHSHKLILGWITRIGLIISLVALGLAFVTFVCLPRPCRNRNGSKCFKLCDQGYRPTYLKKVRTSIHTNLIFSLAVGEALFLWGIEETANKITCYTVAALLHYLFLVAFHWMAAEGVILYLVLVKVFQRKSSKKDKRMFMVICWGFPAAIVCISLAVGHENYLHENCCWLSVKHGLIWSFVGPALTIIMVNVFFLCCTFRVMGKRQRLNKNEKNMTEQIRYWAKGAAIVMCLLGITWVFGVFFIHSDSIAIAYLFNIFNVFQGLFIFIFHCLLDEKIRQQYYQIFCVVTNGESWSPSHSSGTVKKERRRSTFNSWLWSVVPTKYQDSKSESCPTVAENTLKRLASSTHSLSPYIDRKVQEIKLEEIRPRGMSSIYHDSDENMDNIPDNILTVKHSKTSTEGLNKNDSSLENNLILEDCENSTSSRENSGEISQDTSATCEDCVHEVNEWDEQQEIETKTNSLYVQERRKHHVSCSRDTDSDCESETDNECSEEKCIVNTVEDTNRDDKTDQCTSYTSVVPQIILSDYSYKNVTSTPKCHKMVKIPDDNNGMEIGSGNKVACSTSV